MRLAGHYISRVRKSKGIKAVDVCKEVGISQSALSRFEHGKANLGATTLELIAKYVGADVDLVCKMARKVPPDVADVASDSEYWNKIRKLTRRK